MKQTDPNYHRNFITNEGVASYAHVWEKAELPNGVLSYSMAFLIPKSDKKGIADIETAIKSATISFFGADEAKWPKTLNSPLHDGDDSEKDRGEAYYGHVYFHAKSDSKPGIVDNSAKPIFEESEFYSGCKCRISINFYGYNKGGNKGVGTGLNNIMKISDGTRLDGRKAAESEFEAFAVDSDKDDDF